jgi:hypothetical protein
MIPERRVQSLVYTLAGTTKQKLVAQYLYGTDEILRLTKINRKIMGNRGINKSKHFRRLRIVRTIPLKLIVKQVIEIYTSF